MQRLVPGPSGSPAVVSSPSGAPSLSVPTPTPTPSPVRPSLTVLNDSRVSGLAATAAADFARGGWTVVATGNYGGRVPETTVYYEPGQRAAAAALRAAYPAVTRALPRFPGLPGHGLTVVVTRSYPH